MKLLYLSNARIPTEKAHGTQMIKMCEAFAKQGLDVTLSIPMKKNYVGQGILEFYSVERVFKIVKIPFREIKLFYWGKIGFFCQLTIFALLCRIFFRRKQFDIIYAREQFFSLFYKNLYLEIHSLPVKITWFHRWLWQRTKILIVLTSYLKKELVDCGVSANKILIAPDGVDPNQFTSHLTKEEAREKLGLPLINKKIAAYVGSFYLYDWKGIDTILESAKYLEDDFLLLLVGGKSEEIVQVKDKYPFSNIKLVGRVSHKDIPIYLKAADILVLPNKKGDSNSEKYTSPLKLFEYLAAGRPIVASDLPSLREILNEKNAVFFEAGNALNLSQKIKQLAFDETLGGALAAQSLSDVKKYTWEERARSIIKYVLF